jgi:putative addiction module component
MTEKGRDLLGAVLELDASERAWFAREVVASLDGIDPMEEVEAGWAEEIRRRVGEIERGEVTLEDWAKTRDRLLRRSPD